MAINTVSPARRPQQPLRAGTPRRSRARRLAAVSAGAAYLSAYGAGVLGVLSAFTPTGSSALDALVAAGASAVLCVACLLTDRRAARGAPPLRLA